MNRHDGNACIREIDPWVDLDWDETAVCEFRDCDAKATWIVGYRADKAERFTKSRFACGVHARRFCERHQLQMPLPKMRAPEATI